MEDRVFSAEFHALICESLFSCHDPRIGARHRRVFIQMADLLARIDRKDTVERLHERSLLLGRMQKAGHGPWRRERIGPTSSTRGRVDRRRVVGCGLAGRDKWCVLPPGVRVLPIAEADVRFFMKADEAATRGLLDALEVYNVCVQLGFRASFAKRMPSTCQEELSLPRSLLDWLKRTATRIHRSPDRPPLEWIAPLGVRDCTCRTVEPEASRSRDADVGTRLRGHRSTGGLAGADRSWELWGPSEARLAATWAGSAIIRRRNADHEGFADDNRPELATGAGSSVGVFRRDRPLAAVSGCWECATVASPPDDMVQAGLRFDIDGLARGWSDGLGPSASMRMTMATPRRPSGCLCSTRAESAACRRCGPRSNGRIAPAFDSVGKRARRIGGPKSGNAPRPQ